MAKTKEEAPVEVFQADVTPAKKTVVLVRPSNKSYSFEQWAKIRDKAPRHLGGMRAFLGVEANFRYTLDVWDAKMSSY